MLCSPVVSSVILSVKNSDNSSSELLLLILRELILAKTSEAKLLMILEISLKSFSTYSLQLELFNE